MVEVDWWETAPDERLSQGDVIADLPIVAATQPFAPLAKNKYGAWTPQPEWTADKDGIGHALARGRVCPVLVLSHDCELDKAETKSRVIVAPVALLSALGEEERNVVLAQKRISKMPLPNVPTLGDAYADLRSSCAIDRRLIDMSKRLGSLSSSGLGRLRLQLIAFYTRFDASKYEDTLSFREK